MRLLLSPLSKIILAKLNDSLCVTKANGEISVLRLLRLLVGFDPLALVKTFFFPTKSLGPHFLFCYPWLMLSLLYLPILVSVRGYVWLLIKEFIYTVAQRT